MEIYFDKIKEKIIEELSNAQFNIFASIAWIEEKYIIIELLKCLKRGIPVEIIINDDDRFLRSKGKFIEFENYGGKLHLYDTNNSLMHNKFCVIDLCTTITGSFNWTYGATKHQENIIIEKNNIEVAHKFAKQFNKLKRNSTLFSDNRTINVELMHEVEVESSTIFNDDIEGKGVIIQLMEGNRRGLLLLKTNFDVDPSFISNKIKGFWRSKLDVESYGNKEANRIEYYEFVCLDPKYMKYLN